MAVPDDALETLPEQTYAQVREQVRDGDLILCSATDLFSRAIRWATKSPWSHVAIAFRMPDVDRVLVLECVDKLGVRTVPLSAFISATSSGRKPYPGKLVLARHSEVGTRLSRARLRKLLKFAMDRAGAPFAKAEVAKILARILFGRLRRRMPGLLHANDAYICSEYVACCYEEIGVTIAWDRLGFIAPKDIAADPTVRAVARIVTDKGRG